MPESLEPAALLDRLADEMELTHRAILAFNGQEFLQHAATEARLCRLLSFAGKSGLTCALPSRILRLVRIRKALLRSTGRTVRALFGVCAVSYPTYEFTQTRFY